MTIDAFRIFDLLDRLAREGGSIEFTRVGGGVIDLRLELAGYVDRRMMLDEKLDAAGPRSAWVDVVRGFREIEQLETRPAGEAST